MGDWRASRWKRVQAAAIAGLGYPLIAALGKTLRWRVSGLLDFENAVAGDPLLDFAKAYCYSPRRSEATLRALVEGYGDVRDDWRDALDLYALYHWLELWDWFAACGSTKPLAEIAAEMRGLLAA